MIHKLEQVYDIFEHVWDSEFGLPAYQFVKTANVSALVNVQMVDFSDKIDLRRRIRIIGREIDLQLENTFSVRRIIWAFYGCYPLQAFLINALFYSEVALLIDLTKFFFDPIKCKNFVRPLFLCLYKLFLMLIQLLNLRVFFIKNLLISLLSQFGQFTSIKVKIF